MINRLLTNTCSGGENIFQKMQRNFSKKQSSKRKARWIEDKKSHLFAKISKIKRFDFKQEGLEFPLSIPLKIRYMYRPKKHVASVPGVEDFIDFKLQTGNEILLNMRNFTHFRENELVDALYYLVKTPGSDKIDWNNHEIMRDYVGEVCRRFAGLKASSSASITRLFTILKINDETFWKWVTNRFMTIHPALKGKNFAYIYNGLMSRDETSDEFRKQMTELMPRELERFNQDDQILAFENVLKYDLLTDYLWHNQFHMLFWKKRLSFNMKNTAKIIRLLIKIEYFEEPEWWNAHFLPGIDYQVNRFVNKEAGLDVIAALKELNQAWVHLEVESYIKKINERINYLNTKYVLLQNGQFHNMVLNDMEYYKQKEIEKAKLAGGESNALLN